MAGMARQESQREDLLRDATALAERIELAPPGNEASDHVVVGFRTVGAMSIFFGEDPVYQFNTAGQLRRAFSDGLLLKAERGRLVSLRRDRHSDEVRLLRHELADDEQALFLSQIHERLREFAAQLEAGRLAVIGQVPAEADVLSRVTAWLASHDSLSIADSPRVEVPHC